MVVSTRKICLVKLLKIKSRIANCTKSDYPSVKSAWSFELDASCCQWPIAWSPMRHRHLIIGANKGRNKRCLMDKEGHRR